LLIFYGLSMLWLFIAVFFIDERWWFFLFEITALTMLLLYLYREEIWNTSPLREQIKFTAFCVMIGSSVFVLVSSIITSPWWLLGLTIPSLLLLFWKSLKVNKSIKIEKNIKHLSIIVICSTFTMSIALYSIPKYVKNSNESANYSPQPANSYNNDPAKIYCLYGCNLETATREHIFARSWFGFHNRANDNHNMIWANPDINNERGDKEFGVGPEKFEPENNYKGDVARALLYMYVTYGDMVEFRKTKIDIELMKRWSAVDPVSREEVMLNDCIKTCSIQKNTNIFVDNPLLVNFIQIK